LNYVKINKPDQSSGYRPFFQFLSYISPHANNEEGARSGNGMQVPSDAPYSNESWPQVEKNKAAMITRMDADIGKLLAQLAELKIEDQTLILFSSDNGPHKEGGVDSKFFQSSGPFRGIKRDLYEGGIRVPFIAHWPGKIKPGQISPFIGSFADVVPTLGEIGGAKSAPATDGISFAPTLLGKAQTNQHDFLYWEFHERGFQQAARMANWKALRPQAGEPLELYNLEHWPIRKPSETKGAKKKSV
jgi:arylsulfatase A-like enzyme